MENSIKAAEEKYASNWIIVAPLSNFRTTLSTLQISPSVTIEPLCEIEKDMLLAGPPLTMEALRAVGTSFYQAKSTILAGRWNLESEFFTELAAFITGLRLQKPGDVGVNFACTQMGTSGIALRNGHLDPLGLTTNRYWVEYLLEPVDIRLVQPIAQFLLQEFKKNRPFGLKEAIERFNKSYSRSQAEDRMVDLVIALEDLLLREEGGREKKSLLSKRGSILIENRQDRRSSLILSAMYETRNQILHGNKKIWQILNDPKIAEIFRNETEFLSSSEELARRVLRTYINIIMETQKSIREINLEVDEQNA